MVLKNLNAHICFRTSFSWVGNNPSLQIHSICENWAKCDWTCDPTDEVFSSVLMRQDLHLADSSYLPWYEAYDALCLSHHIFYWCLAGKASPSSDDFWMICSLKHDSAQRKYVCIVACCLILITVHDLLRVLTWFRFSHPHRFWVEYSFPSYLFCPA